jgi:hypothetical protein
LTGTDLGYLSYGINTGTFINNSFFLADGNVELLTYFNENKTINKKETYRLARRTFPPNVNFSTDFKQALYTILVLQKVPGPSIELEQEIGS